MLMLAGQDSPSYKSWGVDTILFLHVFVLGFLFQESLASLCRSYMYVMHNSSSTGNIVFKNKIQYCFFSLWNPSFLTWRNREKEVILGKQFRVGNRIEFFVISFLDASEIILTNIISETFFGKSNLFQTRAFVLLLLCLGSIDLAHLFPSFAVCNRWTIGGHVSKVSLRNSLSNSSSFYWETGYFDGFGISHKP